MKRLLVFWGGLLLFAFVCLSCERINQVDSDKVRGYRSKQDEILVIKGTGWLNALCSKRMMGRRVGTQGDSLAHSFLCNEIELMGYDPVIDSFETNSGTKLRNIIVTIKGEEDSTIVIGAHYDGAVESSNNKHYCAAEDNGSGVVTLLMLLNRIAAEGIKTNKTVLCCFWDGEESFENSVFRGSRHFARSISKTALPLFLFYFNLDTIGHDHNETNEIYFNYYGNERTLLAVNCIVDKGRLKYLVSPQNNDMVSDYTPFFEIGVPFLSYHDHDGFICEHPNHSMKDIPEAISIDRLVLISSDVKDAIECY